MIRNYQRTIKIITDSDDYEIMKDPNVKNAMIERLHTNSDDYDNMIENYGIRDLDFTIFGSGFKVSINHDNYYDLFAGKIFSTNGNTTELINSIRIDTAGRDLEFTFNIK